MRKNPVVVAVVGIVALIIVVILIAPFIQGRLIKTTYVNFVQNLSNRTGTPLKIDYYKTGWFSSEAQLTMVLNPDEAPGEPQVNLVFNEKISHGPFVRDPLTGSFKIAAAAVRSEAHLNNKAIEIFLWGDQPAFRVATLFLYGDKFAMSFQSAAINKQLPGEINVVWQGMSGTGNFVFNANEFTNDIQWQMGNLSLQKPPGSATIESISVEDKKQCPANNFCSGTTKVTIPNVAVAFAPDINFSANDTVFSANYSVDPQKILSAQIDFTTKKIQETVRNYDIGPANAKLVFNGWDLEQFWKLVQEIKTKSSNIEMQNIALNQALDVLDENMLPLLFTQNSMLALDYDVNTSFGVANGSFKLNWPSNVAKPKNIAEIQEHINISFNTRIASSLVTEMLNRADGKNAFQALALNTATQPAQPLTSGEQAMLAPSPGPAVKGNPYKDYVASQVSVKAITPSVAINLNILSDQNLTQEEYDGYIAALQAQARFTPEIGSKLRELYAGILKEKNKPLPVLASTGRTFDYETQIKTLVAENRLTESAGNQILALEEQNLEPNVFEKAIDGLTAKKLFAPALGALLKEQYAKNHSAEATSTDTTETGTTTTTQTSDVVPDLSTETLPASTTPAPASQVAEGTAHQQFNKLLEQGWIVQDGDDYVMNVTYINKILTVNGKPQGPQTLNALLGTQVKVNSVVAKPPTQPSAPSVPTTSQ